MFGERTPFLPSADFANKGKEIELFSNKINENIYYSPATSEYSIISTFCLNKELKTEEPIPNYDINEANLNCSNDSYNLYDFNLLCEGGSVSGCEFLFNQILITFKLINN